MSNTVLIPPKFIESKYSSSFEQFVGSKLYEYSVENVLYELNNGNFRNKHFLPQTFFLGENLNYFSHIFKLNQLDQLCKTLESFFNVDKIKIPHLQTGKTKKIELTKYQIEKIQTIYKNDYILLDKFL